MTLVNLTVDLGRVADSLEKLVFLLERLVYPPPPAELKVQQATLDDLHIVTPEDHQRILDEQAAFAERYQVVPGSEAFAHALAEWETEQRSIYGEAWEAPEDWRTILKEAGASGGSRGEPAGSSSVPGASA